MSELRVHIINIPPLQKSIIKHLSSTDKKSERFFKVFYDRMRDAQAEIKATVTVNTGEGITGKAADEKETAGAGSGGGVGSKEGTLGGHQRRSKLCLFLFCHCDPQRRCGGVAVAYWFIFLTIS